MNSLALISTVSMVALATIVFGAQTERGRYDNQIEHGQERFHRHQFRLKCVSGSDCDTANECSVMGMQRYSEPRCEDLGVEGSPCRPGQEPENRTLHYPFGAMQCEDVYLQFCPCANGLVCDDGVCRGSIREAISKQQQSASSNDDNEEHQFELLSEYPRFH